MKSYTLTIAAPHGLHSRTAAKIVELVRRNEAKVRLFDRNNHSADGDSILSLLYFGTALGKDLRVEVESQNEDAIANGLSEIFGELSPA